MRQVFDADFNDHNRLHPTSRLALLIPISELQARLGFTIEADHDEVDGFLGAYFESAGVMAHAKERHRSYPGVIDVYLQSGTDRAKFVPGRDPAIALARPGTGPVRD